MIGPWTDVYSDISRNLQKKPKIKELIHKKKEKMTINDKSVTLLIQEMQYITVWKSKMI
jgi:hypothetical protein